MGTFGLGIFVTYVLISWGFAQRSHKEIIKFSHKDHLIQFEVTCEECHSKAAESVSSSDNLLPRKDDCGNCHDVTDEQECLTCHISQEVLEPFENPVRTINFNHKVHLEKAELQCKACHQGLEKVDYCDGKNIPPKESCNVCHNGTAVSQDCDLCHLETLTLLPPSHVLDWKHEHAVKLRAGQERDCVHCHQNYECQECHEDVDLLSADLYPQEYFASYRPNLSGTQSTALTRVHDLNYRYWHPLEAEGKQQQCAVCHETSTTCVKCHSEVDQTGGKRHRPAWHGGADWGAIALGVGTGGGQHAELARRDIERCAACHDVEGADPTCLMCHTDFDGIKGTDPKTHDRDFADRFGEGSAFHEDRGALCYNCHTYTGKAGEGFCGYCHGAE